MTDSANTLTELRVLSKIIQDSIDAIAATVTSHDMDFPSPHTTFTLESEAARMLPGVEKASSLIVSAAMQLIFAVRSPMMSAVACGMQHAVSAAIGIAVAANVPESLRESGPNGAHVNDIAKASNIDANKLAQILRVLATHHIFREVKPDIFANNRVSSVLDTGHSVEEILNNPLSKHKGPAAGVAAIVGHCSDDCMKAAAYFPEALLDPKTALSEEPTEAPRNVAMRSNDTFWQWLEKDEARRIRFGHAMEGLARANDPDAILEGFGWDALARGSKIVDVGGGIGAQSMTLAHNYSHLRFVVQDREETLRDAVQFWDEGLPGALQSGRVMFQAHDFLDPQPINDAAVFLLRMILHDWSDKYCIRILDHLRRAATPATRLVVVDDIVFHTCQDSRVQAVPGVILEPLPAPLLPNGGYAAAVGHYIDIQMIEMFNAKHRTVAEFKLLFEKARWKLERVVLASRATAGAQKLIAVPM